MAAAAAKVALWLRPARMVASRRRRRSLALAASWVMVQPVAMVHWGQMPAPAVGTMLLPAAVVVVAAVAPGSSARPASPTRYRSHLPRSPHRAIISARRLGRADRGSYIDASMQSHAVVTLIQFVA